jgi:hypothetical protein
MVSHVSVPRAIRDVTRCGTPAAGSSEAQPPAQYCLRMTVKNSSCAWIFDTVILVDKPPSWSTEPGEPSPKRRQGSVVNSNQPTMLLTLHSVRLLGFADTDAVAKRFSQDSQQVERLLIEAGAKGWAARSSFGGSRGWSLTVAGRIENERLLAEELEAAGARASPHMVRVPRGPDRHSRHTAINTGPRLTGKGYWVPRAYEIVR